MEIQALAVIGASTGGLAAVLGYAYWRVSGVMPFLYANSRIHARSNHMLNKAKTESLVDAKNLGEVINTLQDTDYGQHIESNSDLRQLHSSIEKGFLESIKDMRKSSPKSIHSIMDAYLGLWEAKIIKTFYRQRFTQGEEVAKPVDEVIAFPVGDLDAEKIKHLNETKTIADLKVVLNNTVYAKAFEEKAESLEEFEIALDKIVFEEFVKSVTTAKIQDREVILDLFNTKFDILNLLVLLKCEARDINEDKRKRLLIENDSMLFKRADTLVYAKGVKDLVDKCKGLEYYSALETALGEYEGDNSLSHFEKELLKLYMKKVDNQELAHFQGPFPLIAFLVKKELEQRNLLIITKGIDSNFSKQEIKELIV